MSEQGKQRVVHLEKKTLKRKLGVFDLFSIGYGDVGSSIYYALGVTAFFALGATPISLFLAGIVFICTALTYAEMTSMFPESGGSAAFSRYAFNDLISFGVGWGLLLDYIVTIAISSFAIPPYLSYLFSSFGIHFLHNLTHQILGSVLVIVILFFINLRGSKESTSMSLILTILTIITQLAIIGVAGFLLLNLKEVVHHFRIGVPGDPFSPTWGDFWKGTAIAMVAYTGIESIAQLSAETRTPSKIVPRAIKLTMYTLIVLYIGISVVAFSAVTPQDLGTKYIDDPIAGVVSALPWGAKFFAPWVGLIAAIILFIASNAGLLGASRLSYWMGQFYQIPRFFYALHGKFRTPYIALGFFSLLAAIVILLSRGKMLFLADLYNFGAMLAFFAAHLSLIVLRFKNPDMPRPFRAPLNIPIGKTSVPLTAVIGLLSTFAVWMLVVITKPEGRNAGCAWMIIGIIMYVYYRKKKRIAWKGKVQLEAIKMEYHPLQYKKILVPIRSGASGETVQIACELAKSHKADVTVVHILAIPDALPYDAPLQQRTLLGEDALKRAEAIGRELNVHIDLKLIRARHLEKALQEVVKEDKPDLVIVGASKSQAGPSVAKNLERLLKKTPCRVWICRGKK